MPRFDRRRTATRLSVRVAWVLALGFAAGAGLARAEEAAGVAPALKALKDARKAKDEDQVRTAIDALVDAHNASETPKARSQVQAALGGLLKEKTLATARDRAAYGLGKLNDPKGAFKQLKGALPGPKTPGTDGFARTVLAAVAELKTEEAVAPLVKLIGGTKEPAFVSGAAAALAKFGQSKKREPIAEALLEALERAKKAYDKAAKSKQKPDARTAAQALWVRAAPDVTTALNELTGEQKAAPSDWLDAFNANKREVSAFFKPD